MKRPKINRLTKFTRGTFLLFAMAILTPLTLSYSTETLKYPVRVDINHQTLIKEYQAALYQDEKSFRQWANNVYHQYGQNIIKMLADKTSELPLNFDTDVVSNAVYLSKFSQS